MHRTTTLFVIKLAWLLGVIWALQKFIVWCLKEGVINGLSPHAVLFITIAVMTAIPAAIELLPNDWRHHRSTERFLMILFFPSSVAALAGFVAAVINIGNLAWIAAGVLLVFQFFNLIWGGPCSEY